MTVFHKATHLLIVLAGILIVSCASQKESARIPAEVPAPAEEAPVTAEPVPEQDMRCREDTSTSFNFSGIRVLPFLKVAFFDMDGDGSLDMIAGSKKGTLQLYRIAGASGASSWRQEKGYFEGINAGAFSAPSAGDFDGDGRTEIVVGTGGFSSASGRILIFRNSGTGSAPRWEKATSQNLDIGDDAAPTVVDYDFDGLPDIIAANSEGNLFFFRNISRKKNAFRFERDRSRKVNRSFDKYAVPSALQLKDRVILLIGTSMGQVYKVEMKRNSRMLKAQRLSIEVAPRRFLSPSFANLVNKNRFDLVLSDGDGILSYYENRDSNFGNWVMDHALFNNRLVAGPAVAPALFTRNNKMNMVVGTIDGTLKFYEMKDSTDGLPWIEKKEYLDGIKVSGFSRGILAQWMGKDILITGESSGTIKAFMNRGTRERPSWKEEKRFFEGLTFTFHSTPVVYDLDGDNTWELVTGSEDGRLYAYRSRGIKNGLPEWELIAGLFDHIRVQGFSVPSFVRHGNTLYLFVGQENGSIKSFAAKTGPGHTQKADTLSRMVFQEQEFIKDIKLERHSSPYATLNNGVIELVAGDYDGNLRHFLCN
ncbi:MAG: VCBS repeat-containing protein [Nitrospiraceae bacterium]|nr:MAG: VCBS repeat-containing protein [Nitrospiraceae bacterium]